MNDLLKVAVFYARNDLVKKVSSFVCAETPFADNVIEELSTGDVFINEKDVCGSINDFIQADNVWMGTEMQDIDFSLNLFFHSKLLDLRLVQDLHRNLVPRDDMCG